MSERFSASRAGRLIQCPGSAHLELSIPGWVPPVEDDTKGMRGRGKILHEFMEVASHLALSDQRNLIKAMQYVLDVRKGHHFTVLTEAKTTADWLKTKPSTTVDLVLHNQQEIHVIDHKFGAIPVEVIGNEQLMFYAACFQHLAPKADGVHVHICQPSADNMVSHFVTRKELFAFMMRVRVAEDRVIALDTTLQPSDHCTFCPAYPHSRSDKGTPLCPAAMQLLYPAPFDEAAMLSL